MLILGLRADGAHGVTPVAAAVVPIPTAPIEVEVARVLDVARVERGRPVVAARTGMAEAPITAPARKWEEKLTSVISSHKETINSIMPNKS